MNALSPHGHARFRKVPGMGSARWILLIWLGAVVVSTVVAGWVVMWHRLSVRRDAWRLQAAFDALMFDTPAGRVTGDALTVVKIAYQIDPEPPAIRPPSTPDHWNSLWYAAGPGPSYFLVICTIDARAPQRPPQWRVRALDESLMRAALTGDRRAGMLAFGEAIEA